MLHKAFLLLPVFSAVVFGLHFSAGAVLGCLVGAGSEGDLLSGLCGPYEVFGFDHSCGYWFFDSLFHGAPLFVL